MSFTQTGTKHDGNKPDLGLIYPMLLIQTAHVLAEGESEYGVKNWQGLLVSRIVAAIDRHMLAIKMGEIIDPKSKKPHYAHVTAGCSFLAWFHEHGVMDTAQNDLRWKNDKAEANKKAKEAKEMSAWVGVDLAKGPDMSTAVLVVPAQERRDIDVTNFGSNGAGESPPSYAELLFPDRPVSPYAGALMKDIIGEVVAWADGAIGSHRTYESAIRKLAMEELPELLLDPASPMEWADVAIIVLDLASLAGIDPVKAIRDKLEINRGRIFEKNPVSGLFKHRK